MKKSLQIEGMHCAGCANSVESALAEVKGVKSASVNLATEKALVEFENGSIDEQSLRKAVQDAGYDVKEESPGKPASEQDITGQKKLQQARSNMWWAWGLTAPIILWMLPEMIAGVAIGGELLYHTLMIALSTAVITYPGWETLKGAWKSAINR